jgi:hypothetical protein
MESCEFGGSRNEFPFVVNFVVNFVDRAVADKDCDQASDQETVQKQLRSPTLFPRSVERQSVKRGGAFELRTL